MRTTIKIALLLCACLVCLPAQADYEKGRRAANNGDFGTALKEWRPLAEAGDADSQYGLARMYARGDGVRQSFTEAARWFRKAAEQGHAGAAEKLAIMYERGDGVSRDEEQSRLWRKVSRTGLSGISTQDRQALNLPQAGDSQPAPALQEPPAAAEQEYRPDMPPQADDNFQAPSDSEPAPVEPAFEPPQADEPPVAVEPEPQAAPLKAMDLGLRADTSAARPAAAFVDSARKVMGSKDGKLLYGSCLNGPLAEAVKNDADDADEALKGKLARAFCACMSAELAAPDLSAEAKNTYSDMLFGNRHDLKGGPLSEPLKKAYGQCANLKTLKGGEGSAALDEVKTILGGEGTQVFWKIKKMGRASRGAS